MGGLHWRPSTRKRVALAALSWMSCSSTRTWLKCDDGKICEILSSIVSARAGIDVVDLGIDVSADKFIQGLKDNPDAKAVGMSALLTTTMPVMKDVVELVKARGLQNRIKVIVGGAAVSDAWARQIGADLRCIERDFSAQRVGDGWIYHSADTARNALPLPAMAGAYQLRNAAGALAALYALQHCLPVSEAAIHAGLASAQVPGRFQRIADRGGFEWVLDVAHNADSARTLAANLARHPATGCTVVLCPAGTVGGVFTPIL